LQLTVFLEKIETAERAADAWAALSYIEKKSQWWKVELLRHVVRGHGGRGVEGGMSEFVRFLGKKHGIEISRQYATQLRVLGQFVEKRDVMTSGLANRVRELPISTAYKVTRAKDTARAVEVAESGTRGELEDFLRQERIDLLDPLHPSELRYFDVWNFAYRAPGQGWSGHEWGGVCGQVIENLLWYYTNPNDLVIDPMAGTGTTYDACMRMQRRCIAYDKYPIRDEIKQNDITEGLPDETKGSQFIYLDPPYFIMKKNEFRDYDHFLDFLRICVKAAREALRPDGYVALILMDVVNKGQKNWPLIGDAYSILKSERMVFERLVGVPLTTQQFSGFNVEKTRKRRKMLGINRQTWIFRRSGP